MSDRARSGITSRRGLLKTGTGLGVAGFLGASASLSSRGVSGFDTASSASGAGIEGVDQNLVVLGDRPLNAETPAHLLDDKVTPADRLFIRNNGIPPSDSEINVDEWKLEIDGLVDKPLSLTIADLKSQFETVSLQLQMECGGNGRKFFSPGASGNQWTFGAIACPMWTGVRLSDVLKAAGVKSDAVYTAHFGADHHLTFDPEKEAISRGVPIEKAMEEHNLIAWAVNGEDMPINNGHPLRLVVPGWPGSCSQKWLTRISIIDKVHDGAKMTGKSYRVPAYPVAPGTDVPDEDMEIIHSLPVKSLITFPATGSNVPPRQEISLRGHAWAGDDDVAAMHISSDFGQTWIEAELDPPKNKYAWQHWRADIVLPQAGYFEIWARATDDQGRMQPATPPGWNPKGYLNNMQHRIALFAV